MKGRFLLLIGFLLLLTGVRWWLGASLELSPDECYHYLWAQHPDVSYYSQGPGVALAIMAGTSIFGTTEFGVRFFSPLLGLCTSFLVYLLGRKLSRERVAFWSVVGLNLLPLFNVESVLITPNSLSIFFWAAALYLFWRAIERSPGFSFFWPLTGIAIGLGYLCKYENALALVSIGLFLLVVPKYRREWRHPNFYVLLLCFAPFLIPTILWNVQHDWLGLDQMSTQAILNALVTVRTSRLGESLLAQLALYSPLLLLCLLIALFGSIRKSSQNSRVCLLLTFSWPILLIYVILVVHQVSDPGWTIPALVGLAVLATHYWLQRSNQRVLVSGFCVAALILSGLQSALAINTNLARTFGLSVPYDFDLTSRMRGWQTIAEAIDKFKAQFENKLGAKVFLIGNEYQTASMLSFYLKDKPGEGPGHPPVYIPESQDIQNEFSFWPRYDEFVEADPSAKRDTTFTEEAGVNPFIDRTALYITDRPEAEPPQNLESAFTRCLLVAVYELERKDLPLRQIRIFACYQYQTLPL
ncbi:MAG: glycosyltransferase family 39 protein [Verrucomicrobia bacterium]|nr:glycosyltransferase family 39 protein [Verrucomicrobiota bacterium]